MEVRDPKLRDETIKHGDVRLPEMTGIGAKGPSQGQVILHLAGIGLGFLLLLVGLGLGLSRNMWDALALIPLIAGGALVAGWITINYHFLATMLRNRRVLVGTNAVFMALLAAVLLVLLNFISYRHYRQWDMTIAGRHTLSPKTERVLASLDKDVTVITFEMAKLRTANEETLGRLKELLGLYTQASNHIKTVYLKPDVDRQMAQMAIKKYGLDPNYRFTTDDVFVVSGDRKKMLQLADMMEWEYTRNPVNPYERRPKAFKGEQYITSAILEVTEAKQPKIYILTGHGERSITDSSPAGLMDMAGGLKRDNLIIKELAGIPNDGVPADCDCLVIAAPQAKLAPDEVEHISGYLNHGGRLLVCEDVQRESGLKGLLAKWGVKIGTDVIISRDARTLLGSNAAFIASTFGKHEITDPLNGFFVAFNLARSVQPGGPSPKVRVTSLVKSSLQSYAEKDLDALFKAKTATSVFDPEVDTKGPVSIAVAVEENSPKGSPPTGGVKPLARIVVFGDVDAFSNQIMELPMKNMDLCRNSINWLLERKDLIAIDARPEVEHRLVVDAAAKRTVFWLMVIGLPLLVLLLGGIVWAVRSYGSRTA